MAAKYLHLGLGRRETASASIEAMELLHHCFFFSFSLSFYRPSTLAAHIYVSAQDWCLLHVIDRRPDTDDNTSSHCRTRGKKKKKAEAEEDYTSDPSSRSSSRGQPSRSPTPPPCNAISHRNLISASPRRHRPPAPTSALAVEDKPRAVRSRGHGRRAPPCRPKQSRARDVETPPRSFPNLSAVDGFDLNP